MAENGDGIQSQDSQPRRDAPLNLDLVSGLEIPMAVRFGSCSMMLGDLLSLQVGSVFDLDRLAEDSCDLLVNGTPVARGEIVQMGERVGFRVLEVGEETSSTEKTPSEMTRTAEEPVEIAENKPDDTTAEE